MSVEYACLHGQAFQHEGVGDEKAVQFTGDLVIAGPSIGPGEDAICGLQVDQVEIVDQSIEVVGVLVQASGTPFFLVQVPYEVVVSPYDPVPVTDQAVKVI